MMILGAAIGLLNEKRSSIFYLLRVCEQTFATAYSHCDSGELLPRRIVRIATLCSVPIVRAMVTVVVDSA